MLDIWNRKEQSDYIKSYKMYIISITFESLVTYPVSHICPIAI